MSENRSCWGKWSLDVGETRRWRIGPTTIWIQRLASEWRVLQKTGDDSLDASLEVAAEADPAELSEATSLSRFARPSDDGTVGLQPTLADRPIVTRPHDPFYIAPGDSVPIHVSSPLWVALSFGDSALPATELPTYRPSDTWLGPNTYEGELCYATRTTCRLRLEEVPQRPHRAVTTVTIANMSPEPLLLERLSVPVTRLSLFQADNGRLWTEDIALRHEEVGEGLVELTIAEGAPLVAGEARRMAPPREPAGRSGLVRAFSALL